MYVTFITILLFLVFKNKINKSKNKAKHQKMVRMTLNKIGIETSDTALCQRINITTLRG